LKVDSVSAEAVQAEEML